VKYINQILQGNSLEVLKNLPDETINCCITSPPYWGLRDYGVEGQLGLEKTPEEYVQKLVEIFKEVKRVLKSDGTVWLNLGDSYACTKTGSFNGGGFKDTSAINGTRNLSGVETSGKCDKLKMSGLKNKNLVGIPWKVAFALQADGWYLRQDIIWHKPNPMPESVKDRCTKAHEYIFLLSKSPKYYYDYESIMEDCVTNENRPFGAVREREYNYNSKHIEARNKLHKNLQDKGQPNHSFHENRAEGNPDKIYEKKNKRSVWTIAPKPFKEAHFAVFPPTLVEPCLLAGCPENGIVLDPFMGSGTVAWVAKNNNRNYVGVELNPEYIAIAERRISSF